MNAARCFRDLTRARELVDNFNCSLDVALMLACDGADCEDRHWDAVIAIQESNDVHSISLRSLLGRDHALKLIGQAVAAVAIHDLTERRGGAFVDINANRELGGVGGKTSRCADGGLNPKVGGDDARSGNRPSPSRPRSHSLTRGQGFCAKPSY